MCHLSLNFWESEKEKLFQYLATGESFASLGYFFRVAKNKVQGTVRDSRKAIWKVLQPIYVTIPTSEEWLRNADELNEICKIPNCIGSIDGKHCRMKCPPNAESLYFNYKSSLLFEIFHSEVLCTIKLLHASH